MALLTDSLPGTFHQTLNVRESDALLTSDGSAKWEATFGCVDLETLPGGDVECLWSSPVYGYGRYLMKPFMKITAIEVPQGAAYAVIYFNGDGSAQLQRTTSLNPPNWQNIGDVTPLGSPILDSPRPDGAAYYRVKLVP